MGIGFRRDNLDRGQPQHLGSLLLQRLRQPARLVTRTGNKDALAGERLRSCLLFLETQDGAGALV